MLKYKILEIDNCNVSILNKIYDLYIKYNEDRTKNDYLLEIINKFYNYIILFYFNNKIIGYTLLNFINDNYILLIAGDSLLEDKYIGNSIISDSFKCFLKKYYKKNKKCYIFWLSNTIYTYLHKNHFKINYPNINNSKIPNEYLDVYKKCLELFTDDIYDLNGELKIVIEYEKNFGKVKQKYAKIRENFKMNKDIDLFLKLNKNYLSGDCLCVFCEISEEDIFKKNNNINIRLNTILSHFINYIV
tara:strand:+ start:840 stop:1574 length:735 start_codon:yes stop_codon:yes gene_type:complete